MYKHNFMIAAGIVLSFLSLGAGCTPEKTRPIDREDTTAIQPHNTSQPSADPMAAKKPAQKAPVVPKKTPPAAPKNRLYVRITNGAFQPSAVNIGIGTTVVWTNVDSVPHTVTAYDGSFDSGTIPPGGTYSHTFDRPVSRSYYCTFHPSMEGIVIAPR